jgi:hypothetical protein
MLTVHHRVRVPIDFDPGRAPDAARLHHVTPHV